ncbi:MAG TPA: ATP synthase F0 subunit B [Candidatus Baltobacteraceae bacterium]|jgi:F-type H+-transporting ATPase subunit b|nr:ATP synthase F0 subunit B [Candidatus Baltobacteraceae bacterium]
MFLTPSGGTMLVQFINFVIFFAILNVVFIRPVSRAIVKRREYINSVTNDYDRYQAETHALRAQAESIRATARREAEQLLARERAEASNQAGAIATQANAKAAEIIAQADRTVAAEMQAARANEPQTVRELADLMVSRALAEGAR